MKFLFGPVNSRRLGRSLGIDLLPDKICNFDCIYCEVGPTTQLTSERKEYVPTRDIIAEIDHYLETVNWRKKVDVFTVTAGGEPTLHSGLGQIIEHLKQQTGKPVVVLTNGATFHLESVRRDLQQADIVIPSLDTLLPKSFRKLNRPATCVDIDKVVQGLITFSHEFSGQIWLEILIARGINDTNEEILALKEVIDRMDIDRVQLNTVVRPPLQDYARPVSKIRLLEFAELLTGESGLVVEVIADVQDIDDSAVTSGQSTKKITDKSKKIIQDEIMTMLKRRPCTIKDIRKTLGAEVGDELDSLLDHLKQAKQIKKEQYGDKEFYLVIS